MPSPWHEFCDRATVKDNVHIPDGFLATPVWAALDLAAAPSVAYMARRAQREFDESRVPLLGVLGAFVFAAQMINFPVGPGTTGHLVGGALLSFTLGPAAAAAVMTAILAIQALVFQDGGILALGANSVNMAVLGVLAGYLPFALWGGGRFRKLAIFGGAALSVLVSALAALSELLVSGVKMPFPVLGLSVALFLISAALEGAITLAIMQALARIQPGTARVDHKLARSGWSRMLATVSLATLVLASVGVLLASAAPDGLERLGEQTGITSRMRTLIHTPLTNYRAAFLHSDNLSKAAAGLAGVALVYCACLALGRIAARNRSL
jgi:cobalt/nickel transport system permease protein